MKSEREAIFRQIRADYGIAKYIRTWGALRHAEWVEMTVDPKAQEALKAINPDRQMASFIACVERFPEIRTIAEREADDECRHVARAIWSKQNTTHPDVKGREWRAIYERLRELLRPIGVDSHDGDFRIVADQVEECTQKIEWMTIELFTPELVQKMQGILRGAILRRWKNPWSIFVQLALSAPALKGYQHGLEVWPREIEEWWDRDALRRHLGARFRW